MKKKWGFLTVLLTAVLLFCSCQNAAQPSPETSPGQENPQKTSGETSTENTVSESGFSTETAPATKTTSGAETTPAAKTETETPPESSGIDPEPASTYTYHIDELNVELEIPEGLYVYRIGGLYMDFEGYLLGFSFADWIIITDMEYSEELIDSQLRTHIRGVSALSEEITHIIYAIALESNEFYPLCNLYPPAFAPVVTRATGDGYCRILDPSCLIEPGGEDFGFYRFLEDGMTQTEKEQLYPIEQWTALISEKTAQPMSVQSPSAPHQTPDFNSDSPYQYTMLNDIWREFYEEAVTALTNDPDAYAYDEAAVAMLAENILTGQLSALQSNLEQLVDVYTDPAVDLYVRASYYADLRCYEPEAWSSRKWTLNDVLVLLQDWKNGRTSYMVFIADSEDTSIYHPAIAGYDVITDLTLLFPYLYAVRFDA